MVSPDGPVRSFMLPMLDAEHSNYTSRYFVSTFTAVGREFNPTQDAPRQFSCCPISHKAALSAEGAAQLPARLRNSYAAEFVGKQWPATLRNLAETFWIKGQFPNFLKKFRLKTQAAEEQDSSCSLRSIRVD